MMLFIFHEKKFCGKACIKTSVDLFWTGSVFFQVTPIERFFQLNSIETTKSVEYLEY